MNTKLHIIRDSEGRPLSLFVTAGQVSDYIGARAFLKSLPRVDCLLEDRGYDADWFRDAWKDSRIRACIPGRKRRKTTVKHDKRRDNRTPEGTIVIEIRFQSFPVETGMTGWTFINSRDSSPFGPMPPS